MEGLEELAAAALELSLALPSPSPRPPAGGAPRSSTRPKSGGTAAIVFGLDLAGLTESVADGRGSCRVKSEGPMISGGADAPPPPLLDVGIPSTPRNREAEPESKRLKAEQPCGADTAPRLVKPVLAIQFPLAGRRARRSRRRRPNDPHPPLAAAHSLLALDSTASDPVPAWVRAELLPRHGLPRDLRLHYVGEKVLRRSDLDSRQARFLVPSGASGRLRAFLSADEIAACGFDCTERTGKREENGKRAKATTYAGVPVSVYVSGGGVWGVSELRLNKFHRSDGTVINGRGYRRFIGRCGLVDGDGVEVWAFRRLPHRLCFLIAKRDDVCPLDSKEAAAYTVGDGSGWDLGIDYRAWAHGKKFRVGDTVEFLYSLREGDHDVVLVDERSFASCSVPSNAPTMANGDDTVTLTQAGKWFFICGVEGHCQGGMKLAVHVH